jgi:16S rRNA (uracil1498-N3)-methyltransferase
VAEGRWVLVADVEAPELAPDDAHHLSRVLRLRPGDVLVLADGAGRWRPGRLTAGGVEADGDIVVEARPVPAVTVAIALTKGERPEVAVQKLTELGVDRIVPFEAARSVARWDAGRAAKHVERLRKVAREAAGQSRRPFLPEVADVATFATVAALPGAALADRDGDPPSLDRPTLLVGPEGGWADEERALGLPRVGLGPQVMRAETAAMAAGWALVALRSGVVARMTEI